MPNNEKRGGCSGYGSYDTCGHIDTKCPEKNLKQPEIIESVPKTVRDIYSIGERIPNEEQLIAVKKRIEAIATVDVPLPLLGQGGESLVFDRDDTVLKIAKRNDVGYRDVWSENRKLFEKIKEYIGNFIPSTTFFESFEGRDVPTEIQGHAAVEQQKIRGKHLNEITEQEFRNPALLKRLADLMEGVIKLSRDEDIVIDWHGTRPNNRSGLGVLNSTNVMIEKDMPYVVDFQPIPQTSITKAITSVLWFIKRKDIRGYFSYCKDAIRTEFYRALTKRIYTASMPPMVEKLRKQVNVTKL